MDPRKVYEHLRETYLRYLETSFHLKNPVLRKQFEEAIRDKSQPPLVRSPILEASPPLKEGCSIEDLVCEGVLRPGFRDLDREFLERSLYAHQDVGIKKAIVEGRNLVIATGTGSGKTEVFLLPILEHLLKEQESGSLGTPGVRALLLYPMNALANDQLERMRTLLGCFPGITFGRYTGETEEGHRKARQQYLSRFDGKEPLVNELICREQMRDSPPHLLLTNYAMLEYLLIRPRDSSLFGGDHWRFVVLDEVHVYSGATGIEIGMLLRRLKDRVVSSVVGRLQCFATSATLGSGRRDHPRIARFANTLFGERFDEADVIAASYRTSRETLESWGEGTPEGYLALREAILDESDYSVAKLETSAKGHFPLNVVNRARTLFTEGSDEDRCRRFLGHLLQGDSRLQRLKTELAKQGAVKLDRLDMGDEAVDLVALASFARAPDGSGPLLSARYHIMARAMSGVFTWIDPGGKLQLLPRRERQFDSGNENVAVFEVGSCNRCGEVFLVGVENEGFLDQPPDVGDDPIAKLVWLSVKAPVDDGRVDEDDAVEAEVDLDRLRFDGAMPMILCRRCGRFASHRGFASETCDGHIPSPVEVIKLENKKSRSVPRKCPSCCNIYESVARRVLTGREAPVAVLTTALYQQVPPSSKPHEAQLPGGGRKLIVFSDSRQDAAFFAPFMNRTYERLKQRRYLAQAIENSCEPIDLGDWARRAMKKAVAADEWEESESKSKRRKDAGRWVLREWTALDRKLSLEGTGLVVFDLRRPRAFAGLESLEGDPWCLDPDRQWALIQVLLDTLRSRGVVSFDDGDDSFADIEPEDPIFEPRAKPSFLRQCKSAPAKGIFAWEPDQSRTNKRLDYLRRILESRGLSSPESQRLSREALRAIWEAILHQNGPLASLFESGLTHKHESPLIRLKPSWWQVSPAREHDGVFKCDTCGTVASLSIDNICPMTACLGSLADHPKPSRRRNHFFRLFEKMRPIPLEVREHTAQLNKEKAYDTQQGFINGTVNILSCTTTFEMGVDVGDLHSVMMRNVPPSPGNFVQRAGRAGRRAGATAVIVTYAQRRTHDFAYFTQWQRLVKGQIRPPTVHLANAKIVRRHVHAEALAEYFRHRPDVFADRLESVFDPEKSVPTEILDFLREHPVSLQQRLARVVPRELHTELGVLEWGWLEDDTDEGESFASRLMTAKTDVKMDWEILAEGEEAASQAKNHQLAYSFKKQLGTLRRRSLLGKLGTYGLMPKYGFPTEVVELKVRSASKEAGGIELARDMKLALTEFAPENEVIANGRKWKSAGIVIPAGERDLHEYHFWQCLRCRYFAAGLVVASADEAPPKTCHCGNSIPAHRYVYPEFGFTTAATSGERVGNSRPPARSYAASYFHDDSEGEEFEPVPGVSRVDHRRGSHGWIHVINDNRQRDFYICMWCGFGVRLHPAFTTPGKSAKTHTKPWSAADECQGKLQRLALGFRYRTDVLELRFPTTDFVTDHSESFWLSLLYAIVNASCFGLEIDGRDLDGCLHYARRDQPSLILYDSSPGGAGFVDDVKDNLALVMEKARELLDCGSCAPDSSCIACLRSYGNQRDHNKLKRGLALEYLNWLNRVGQ